MQEVRIVVNGTVVKTLSGAELFHPANPLDTENVELKLVRYEGSIPLSELLSRAGDVWLLVEAGARLPLAADFGGPGGDKPDGIPDTGDNNGDGKVDRADIAQGAKYGPLRTPAPPTSEGHAQFHFSQVVTGGYPMSFTNPFLLDRNGNGRFDAPGVAAP